MWRNEQNAGFYTHVLVFGVLCFLLVHPRTHERGLPVVHIILVLGRQLQLLIVFVHISRKKNIIDLTISGNK